MRITKGMELVDVDESILPYRHIRHLGTGGNAFVEEVKDCITKRVFARKTFSLRGSGRARMKEQFETR